jgi:hypothetical protein
MDDFQAVALRFCEARGLSSLSAAELVVRMEEEAVQGAARSGEGRC